MIKKGYEYYARNVRFPQDKYTVFTTGVKVKNEQRYKNYSFFCFGKHDIRDGDKVKILDIISVDQESWESNGKSGINYKITAEIENVSTTNEFIDEPAITNESKEQSSFMNDEPVLDISTDDLPF